MSATGVGDANSEFFEASTRVTLGRACIEVGLDAIGAELVRLGEHAVYRLPGSVVARVARTANYAADAYKEVRVARWLATVDFPAVRALAVEQPVEVDGRVVVFWESVSDQPEYGSTAETAALLRRLHALEAPAGLDIPPLRPFVRAEQRIANAHLLSSEDRDYLSRRLVELRARYAELRFALPRGVIHGDASVGNVLKDRAGHPVLVDLDGFAVGPREWDLAITATYCVSFGWHTPAEYEAFVKVYGFDVTAWAGFPVLRDIREFIMVTWLTQKMGDGGRIDSEVRKRLTALRSGASRHDWQPY